MRIFLYLIVIFLNSCIGNNANISNSNNDLNSHYLFVGTEGHQILSYTINENTGNLILSHITTNNYGNFNGIIIKNNQLYVVPRGVKVLVRYDIESGLLANEYDYATIESLNWGIAIDNNSLYLTNQFTNTIDKYKFTDTSLDYQLSETTDKFPTGIALNNSNIYATTFYGNSLDIYTNLADESMNLSSGLDIKFNGNYAYAISAAFNNNSYIYQYIPNSLEELDTIKSIDMGSNTGAQSIAFYKNWAYVSNYNTKNIYIYSIDNLGGLTYVEYISINNYIPEGMGVN